jgi:murein DD-endopeptidase
MKKTTPILGFLMLVLTNPLYGQFHTISKEQKIYQIERIEDVAPIENQQIIPKETPSSAYINSYLSVSFPMKQLIVTSPFGLRKDPLTGKTQKHNGLDLRASEDEVYAMFGGKIKKTGEDKQSGKYVILQHENFQVSYCHLSQIWVKAGMDICPGETVGVTGDTGRATGPHLHITCKLKGKYVDPTILIDYIRNVKEDVVRLLSSHP